MIGRIRLSLVLILLIFLPLSAWLVSLSGNYLVSLGRDVLLALLIVVSFFEGRPHRRFSPLVSLVLVFLGLTLLSYIGREDSLAQWLRGVRYLVEPLVLLGTLIAFPLPVESRRVIGWTLFLSFCLVLGAAVVDYFWPALLRFSVSPGDRGFLGQIHLAVVLPRLQATLAGPNALGLFLLVNLLLVPFWPPKVAVSLKIGLVTAGLVALALTFSRSSYIGLLIGFIYWLWLARPHLPWARAGLVITLLVTFIAGTALIVTQPEELTRFPSNEMRLEQYQRVWQERAQIGWLGRGAGTAGLVSEYSFDKSPNYFTENTYLNIYENIGPLGMLVYIALWLWLITLLARQRTWLAASASAALVGLFIAGLFIDHYTGQAALWMALIMAAVALANDTSQQKSPTQ